MELYTKRDIEIGKDKISNLEEKILERRLENFEPNKQEILNIYEVIYDFIKLMNRKIYGGFAQNEVIKIKNKQDAIYKETDIADIDFYSPDPIKDLMDLSDILYQKGFKYVIGREALHEGTYSLFVNFANVCDISYVPRNIYNRIPFITIEGINYCHPSFMMIDLYRIITEPYFSSFRWQKIFPRLYLLQKYYPFNRATKEITNVYEKPKDKKEIYKEIKNNILEKIKNNSKIILFGQEAYNYYLEESNIMKNKKTGQKYYYLENYLIEIISTEYENDASIMIEQLKNQYGEKITYVESYPFFNLIGYNVMVYFDGEPILNIISHMNRCTPYKKVILRKYEQGISLIQEKDTIIIGSFDQILLLNMIYSFKMRVNFEEEKYHFHNIMTSQLVEMRNYYLRENNKNMFDNTLFEEFIIDCIGYTIDPIRENRLIVEKKFKSGKPVRFIYDPSEPKQMPKYKFPKSTGEAIKKASNLKLFKNYDPKLGKIVSETDFSEIKASE